MNDAHDSPLPSLIPISMPASDAPRGVAAGLALTRGIGPVILQRLLERFGTLSAILAASSGDLRAVPGVGPIIANGIRDLDPVRTDDELRRFEADGIMTILWYEEAYPAALHNLPDRPLILFMRGQITEADANAVAIVGTREASRDGLRVTARWAGQLARLGCTVVSGLARGIDTQAHRTSAQGGGRTLAVVGAGLNEVYPPENINLAQHIAGCGAILSEVHPDSRVTRNALVFRNRLITGLSRAVIVVECGVDSGAMDAARRAHAQGRPVFALPSSEGTRQLLAEFAHPLPVDAEALLAGLNTL